MRSIGWTATALGGLAVAVLVPATASAQAPVVEQLINIRCNYAQVQKAVNKKPPIHPQAPEAAKALAANPGMAQQFFDNSPDGRRAMYDKLVQQYGVPKASPAETSKYAGLATAVEKNCKS